MLSVFLSLLYGLILLAKAASARLYISHFKVLPFAGDLSSVAILQPILSGDEKLESTLVKNLLALPDAHFYWLIDHEDEEALAVANRLLERHPDVTINVQLFDQAAQGINPKLFKLQPALEHCTEEYLVVVDDDTVLPAENLKVLLAELNHATIATGLPSYSQGDNLASRLLANFVNNNAAMTYLATLPFMQAITINGMCYAIKREALLALGGFQAVANHLTDDLAIAELVLKNGGTISQTPFRQYIQTHLVDLSAYMSQMHRWYLFASLLFSRQTLSIQILMTLLYAIPSLLLWLMLLSAFIELSPSSLFTLFAVLIVRHLVISYHSAVERKFTASQLLISIVSELLQPVHYLHAVLVRKIRWRSRLYRVYASNHFESIEQ